MYCGTDIIEIARVKKAIEETGNTFLNKVFTKAEIQYCQSKKKMQYQHFAARFAAKEAIFKAISKKLENKFEYTWTDVEIQNDEQGRPYVHFIKPITNIDMIDISISHCKEYAVAMVVVINK